MTLKRLAVSLLLLGWAAGARAAVVYLKDGNTVQGTVVGATAREIQVHTAAGTKTIPTDFVSRVDYEGAAPPQEAPSPSPYGHEPAPPTTSRFARHEAEPVKNAPDEFSLDLGITGPLSDVKLGAASASNGDVGVALGMEYLHYTSERLALGVDLEWLHRGATSSPGPVPNSDTNVYGGSLIFMGVAKYALTAGGDARPYVLVGAGVHRTNETVDATPNDGFVWSDTQTGETRRLVDGSSWGAAGTARFGVDFRMFDPSIFSLEAGWTALSGGRYAATPAGAAVGFADVTGPIHVLTIAGRWGWRF